MCGEGAVCGVVASAAAMARAGAVGDGRCEPGREGGCGKEDEDEDVGSTRLDAELAVAADCGASGTSCTAARRAESSSCSLASRAARCSSRTC